MNIITRCFSKSFIAGASVLASVLSLGADTIGRSEIQTASITSEVAAAPIDDAYIIGFGPTSITAGTNTFAKMEVLSFGVTDGAGPGAGISVWIGYSSVNNDPSVSSGWTWIPAAYTNDVNYFWDEYTATFGENLSSGTYYVAARFQKNSEPYLYSGLNSSSENYVLNVLQGPSIRVTGSGDMIADGVTIANGDTTPSTADGTNFGSVDVSVWESKMHFFTIENTGGLPLNLGEIEITGADAAQWYIAIYPNNQTLSPGQSEMLAIEYMPFEQGSFSATVSIPSNDPANNPFTFQISGATSAGAPANDACENNQQLFYSDIMVGTTLLSTSEAPFFYSDVWYRLQPICANGSVLLSAATSNQDIDLYVWAGGCPASATGYIASGTSTSLTSESIVFDASDTQTYYVQVVHKSTTPGSSEGEFQLSFTSYAAAALDNSGTPAAGMLHPASNNVVLMGFSLARTNNCQTLSFTGAAINNLGTAGSSDLTNFRIIRDIDNDGIADPGEISSPVGTVPTFQNPLMFSIAGQSNVIGTSRYLLIANVTSGAIGGRTFVGSISASGITASLTTTGSALGNQQTIIGSGPELTPASGATVDGPFSVTFTDNPDWRAAITGITINGTPLTAGYTISAGQITFNPSLSVPSALLQQSGELEIAVAAGGFGIAGVTQQLRAGEATNLIFSTQPSAPSANGGLLSTQPVASVVDQYGNLVTDRDLEVTLTIGSGNWILGGTSSTVSQLGYASFSGITASSNQAVTGATIECAAEGLTGALSVPFDIPGQSCTPNVWTGASGDDWADAANWSCGLVPTQLTDVVIPQASVAPVISADATAYSITVETGGALTVLAGNDLMVTDKVDVAADASVVLQNNANLLQVSNAANSGNITVIRNSSALMRLDYTLWSAPVAGQNLFGFSPLTSMSPASRFYTYTTSTNLYSSVADPSEVTFETAKGYLIRMPNNHPVSPTVWTGSFTGVPNNGDITFNMADAGAGNRFNLVGNPYPSPIDVETFVAQNPNITGTLYFWRKTNNEASPSYCSLVAGTFTSNGEAQVFDPQGVIQTGQGFFVEGNGQGATLEFNNSMRTGNNAGQFFRMGAPEKHRLWLNATSASGAFSQMAVVYVDGADSDAVDMYDGKYINDGEIALNSMINGVDYVIQGRAPFDPSDVVPLRFTATNAGSYAISLANFDGLFSGDQVILLRDNQNGAVTNLKLMPYTFTAPAGASTGRFDVIFDAALSTDVPQLDQGSVMVYNHNGEVAVRSANERIDSVEIYDVRGRLIVSRDSVNAYETLLDAGDARQVLIVRVTCESRQVVTRKIIR